MTFSYVEYPIRSWKIQAFEHQEDAILANSFQTSIAHFANLISSRLIDSEIPHNLVICEKGRMIYLIPRQFDNQELKINTCWNDLAGLVTVKGSDDYQNFFSNGEKVSNLFREKISLLEEDFYSFTESILKYLGSIYVMEDI